MRGAAIAVSMMLLSGCGTATHRNGDDTNRSASDAVRSAVATDPGWYFRSVDAILDDAPIQGGWAQSPSDVVPGGPFTDIVVIGTVQSVEPGRGYVYRDDAEASDERHFVDYDDPGAEARDLVVTVRVEEAWGARAGADRVGDTVTLRFGGPPTWDPKAYASALLGLARAVFFLDDRLPPNQGHYGVVGPGPLIGLIDGGTLTFPGVKQPGIGVEENFMAPIGSLTALRTLLVADGAVRIAG